MVGTCEESTFSFLPVVSCEKHARHNAVSLSDTGGGDLFSEVGG